MADIATTEGGPVAKFEQPRLSWHPAIGQFIEINRPVVSEVLPLMLQGQTKAEIMAAVA